MIHQADNIPAARVATGSAPSDPAGLADYGRAALCYWIAMVGAGAVVLTWALVRCTAFNGDQLVQFLALLIAVSIFSSKPIRIPGVKAVVSASDAFVFLAVLTLGVPAAVVLGAVDNFIGVAHASRRWSSRLSSPAMMLLSVAVSGQVFYWSLAAHAGITNHPLAGTKVSVLQLAAPVLAMAVTQYLVNGLFLTVMYGLKRRCSLLRFWQESYLWTSLAFFAAATATIIFYQALAGLGILYAFLAVPVIAASYATY